MKNIFSTRNAASVAPVASAGTDTNPGGNVRAVIDADADGQGRGRQ